MTDHMSKIQDWLVQDNRIVTLSWLCKRLAVPRQRSLELLETCVAKFPKLKLLHCLVRRDPSKDGLIRLSIVAGPMTSSVDPSSKDGGGLVLDAYPYAIYLEQEEDSMTSLNLECMIGRLASVNMDLLLPSKEQLQVKQQLQGTTGTAKPVMTQPKSLADALMEKKAKSTAIDIMTEGGKGILGGKGRTLGPQKKPKKPSVLGKRPEKTIASMDFSSDDAPDEHFVGLGDDETAKDTALMEALDFDRPVLASCDEVIQPSESLVRIPSSSLEAAAAAAAKDASVVSDLPQKRGRRKKLVKVQKQSFKNGYLVTETVTEQVSESDAEDAQQLPTAKSTKPHTNDSPALTSFKKLGEKKEQGNLFQFFKKK